MSARSTLPVRANFGKLRGELSITPDVFAWPPETLDDHVSFERSMAAGCPPILESFIAAAPKTVRGSTVPLARRRRR